MADTTASGQPSAPATAAPAAREQSPWRRFLVEFLEDKVAVGALIVLVAIIAVALAAPFITPQNPYDLSQVDIMDARQPPGATSMDGFRFWLGSDGAGRDLYSAILYGLRISLAVGVVSGLIAMAVG